MLMIRLQRVGRRNDPSYRVVLTDRRNAPQSGRFKEILGSYDPRNDAPQLKADRITHWIENGAQASDTVYNLLISQKIIDGKKRNVLPQKSPVIDEEAVKKAEEEKAAAAAAQAAPAEEEQEVSEDAAPQAEEASDNAEKSQSEPENSESSEEVAADPEASVEPEEEVKQDEPEEKEAK